MSFTNDHISGSFQYCGTCGGYKGDYIPSVSPSTAQPKPCSCREEVLIPLVGWKCPNCGAGISPGTAQCPNCAPPLKVTC